MRNLSKSKIISYRQCPKRLWLEIHKPKLKDDSASEAVFAIGNQVGDKAQEVYNTDGTGVLIDINEIGWSEAFTRSEQLLSEGKSIVFEAAMRTKGTLALADVMIPVRGDTGENELSWEMIEVKSAASVKDYYQDDIAVQSYIATASGGRSYLISSTTFPFSHLVWLVTLPSLSQVVDSPCSLSVKGSGREMMHENYPHRSCPLLVSSTRLTTLRVLVVATPFVMA